MGSDDRTFVLSESGHIAGIVNPPAKQKYGYWTNPDLEPDADAWKAAATRTAGSWWPVWGEWLAARSGAKVKAREPGRGKHKALADAPGTYVVAATGGVDDSLLHRGEIGLEMLQRSMYICGQVRMTGGRSRPRGGTTDARIPPTIAKMMQDAASAFKFDTSKLQGASRRRPAMARSCRKSR